MEILHQPVLLAEVLTYLQPAPGQVVVDATVGSGGHSLPIRERIEPGGRLIGIDRDPQALERARARLPERGVTLVRGNFRDLAQILDNLGLAEVDGVLFDFGMSSEQLEYAGRGFSFGREGPLDMRADPDLATTAADLVNTLSEGELTRLFREYGEERWAGRIARSIVTHRRKAPISTTTALAALITASVPAPARAGRIHPASRVFMALRIAVNDELAAIAEGLPAAVHRSKIGGRVVAISYHSLEDRAVKETFRTLAQSCRCPPLLPICQCEGRPLARLLTRKPVTPSPAEVAANPRARSAKLRAAQRV
jgi:16S rRNA (cytosine1402-N4)-methyltransferase